MPPLSDDQRALLRRHLDEVRRATGSTNRWGQITAVARFLAAEGRRERAQAAALRRAPRD